MKIVNLWLNSYGWKPFEYNDITDIVDELKLRNIYIGNGVSIGDDVSIGNGVSIGDDVSICYGASIGSRAYIGSRASIGEEAYIGDDASIGDDYEFEQL